MKAYFHSRFEKRYKKFKESEKHKTKERILLFLHLPFDPILNNHALKGRYLGYRSINITGDLRAIYCMINDDVAYFIAINTHSNLYL